MPALRRTRQSRTDHPVDRPPPWRRDVRTVALGRCITMAGAEAGYIALLALAWHLTGSASQASLVLLAAVFAQTLGAPAAGWIGDHVDRRRVIIACDLVIAAALVGMACAHSLWQLMAAMVVTAFAGMTCGAALDASLPNLVPDHELAAANATLGMARTVGHMVGPVLGGLAVAAFGARAAFAFDAGTSVVAAGLMLLVHGATKGEESSTSTGDGAASHGMLEGMRLVAVDPVLRLLLVGWAGMSVCFAFVTAAELPLAVDFGVDEGGLGAIISAWCAGSLVGAWLARRVRIERFGALVLAVNAAACAFVFAAVGIAPVFVCVLALMAVGGASMAAAGVVQSTLVQQRVADGVRARVLAANQGVCSAVWGANLALGGLFVEAFSARAAYVYAGAWCLVGAAAFACLAVATRRERERELIRSLRVRHALESELAAGA